MPKNLRYAGFVEELTYAVSPPPAAEVHVDIASASLDVPDSPQLIYEGGLRRGPVLHRPGFYAPAGGFEYAFDIRSVAYFLKWAFGGYDFTTGTPKRHEMWAGEEIVLPSFMLALGKDDLDATDFEHVFHGCVIDSLEMSIEGEFAKLSCEVVAQKDSKGTIKQVAALVLPTEYPLAFHEVSVELPSGSDVSANVKSLTFSLANGLRQDSGRGFGSRYPVRMPVGEKEVSLTLSLWYEDTDEVERFWGAASGPAAAGPAEYAMKVTANAGSGESLTMQFPRCIHQSVKTQGSGRDEIVQEVTVRCFPDFVSLNDASQVYTEVLATVLNSGAEIVGHNASG